MKGVTITKRKIIHTGDKGRLVELYKHNDKTEVYLSTLFPQQFKGWHKHTKLTQRFICVKGTVIVIMVNDNGVRQEHILLDTSPEVLEIEPGITIGIRNLSDGEAYLICMPDPAYDPSDSEEKVVIKSGEQNNI